MEDRQQNTAQNQRGIGGIRTPGDNNQDDNGAASSSEQTTDAPGRIKLKLSPSRKTSLVSGVIIALLVIAGIAWYATSGGKQPISNNPVISSYQKQLPSLKSAVEKNPKSASNHVKYAQALYVTGDKKAAVNEYKTAAQLDPKNATTQNNLGNTYRDLGDYNDAVSAYRESIKLDPAGQNAYVNLASLQIYTLHKPADGVETYKQAITKLGPSPQFQLLLGLAYEKNNQPDKAKATYNAILQKDPGNQAAKDNLTRLNKA